MKWNRNPVFVIMTFICIALLAAAYYMQIVKHLNPCPLCIAQRLVFMAITLVALLGVIWRGRVISIFFAAASGLLSIGGMGVAGRQIWLQHLPADARPSCGPGLDYLLNNFPLFDVVKNVLTGTGDCAVVDWTFLKFSMAEWAFAWFAVLFVMSIAACKNKSL